MSRMRRLNVDAIMYIGFCSLIPFSRGFHALLGFSSVHKIWPAYKVSFHFSTHVPDVGTMEPSTDHFLKPSRI
jgi:hypothetical protein